MRNIKYSTAEYANMIAHRDIIPLDEYDGAHKSIQHRCMKCEHVWKTQPGCIRNGHGCPNCYRRSISKPLDKVQKQLAELGWTLLDEQMYQNTIKSPSVEPMMFRHTCGEIVESNLDRILRKSKRCLKCVPARQSKKHWSAPVDVQGRHYDSQVEADCCEYLIEKFGRNNITLQKPYNTKSRHTCDAYIHTIDTYVEISSIKKSLVL